MEKIGISKYNPFFEGGEDLIPFWKKTVTDDRSILSLRSEGILLYTLSVLGENDFEQKESDGVALKVKKYIDEHFSDGQLSLNDIGTHFSYNSKYVSSVFKAAFGLGVSEYICSVRIHQARVLMEQGFTTVKDIAYQCGFSDQFYFSKVFKKTVGSSPKEYIESLLKS